MTPDELSKFLRRVAQDIESDNAPSRNKVIFEIHSLMQTIAATTGQLCTVKLKDAKADSSGQVTQAWVVECAGKTVNVRTLTDKNGNLQFLSKEDFDMDVEGTPVSAKAIVQHIIKGAPPSYYPEMGETVQIDRAFVESM